MTVDNKIKQKHTSLCTTLRQWDTAYYVNDSPLVSDALYDASYRQLQALEAQYPELITKDSPTQRVSGGFSKGFKIVKHSQPMLSLYTETDYTINGVHAFMQRVSTAAFSKVGFDKNGSWDGVIVPQATGTDYVVEPKYDGLALDLKYIKGILAKGVTRGNGDEGEDVTRNLWRLLNVPYRIPAFSDVPVLHVRGEVVMNRLVFAERNKALAARGQKLLANPRNAAAGALRTLKGEKVVNEKTLHFYVYGVSDPRVFIDAQGKDWHTTSHYEMIGHLVRFGFEAAELKFCPFALAQDLYDAHQAIKASRDSLNYDIDGAVYKVDYLPLQVLLGNVSREPRWAVAHKYPPEEKPTRILEITTQVGRTGKLTPVANLEPTMVGGVEVTNATLHNQFDLRKRKVRLGDEVTIRRAGDVIPEVIAIPRKGPRVPYIRNYWAPKHCPSCGQAVVRAKGDANSYCTAGHKCPGQFKAYLAHYVSREVMDIKGIGEQSIEKLYAAGLLNTPADLFNLTEDKLRSIGWGEKEAENDINAIAARKDVKLSTFIYSLGIPSIGVSTARALAQRLGDIDSFIHADRQALLSTPDVGPKTADAIASWLAQSDKLARIKELLAAGVTVAPSEIEALQNLPLKNELIVVTGSIEGFSREEVKEKLLSLGAKITSSVSKNTTLVIAGAKATESKVTKAKSLGVKVSPQEAFFDLINVKKA